MKSPPTKNILFLSPFFYPEIISTGKYNSHLACAILDAGYKVTAICSHPLYPDWEPTRTTMSLPEVTIYRGGLNIRYPKSAIFRRIVLELWFSYHCLKTIIRNRIKPDVVFAILPPVTFVLVTAIFFPRRVKIIGVVHDLQGIMAISTAGFFRKIIARILRSIESLAFRRCNRIICLSESMKDTIQGVYDVRKIKCDVQYPFVTHTHSENKTTYLVDVFPSGYKHIVYSGALGEKQRPGDLLNFFYQLCSKRPGVMCHIFSAGPTYESLKCSNEKLEKGGVRFHDLVPDEHLNELYERSDIQVIPQAPGTGAGAFPSKLPNIIAAGVPVFAICDDDSELAKVIRMIDAGCVTSSWDNDILFININNLIDRYSAITHEQQRRVAHPFIKKYFNIQSLVKILQEVAEESAS